MHLAYDDALGRHRLAPPESLIAILRSLGADFATVAEAPHALQAWERERWAESLPPVAVAWADSAPAVVVRVDASAARDVLPLSLRLEQGDVVEWQVSLGSCATVETAVVDGRGMVAKQVPLPPGLPLGYHRLRVEGSHGAGAPRATRAGADADSTETLIVSAPRTAYSLAESLGARRAWGVFLPTYALRSRRTTASPTSPTWPRSSTGPQARGPRRSGPCRCWPPSSTDPGASPVPTRPRVRCSGTTCTSI